MAEVISIANQKGGVAKTTVTFNLGVALALKGKKVLLIDLDPQASLTFATGVHNPENYEGRNILNVIDTDNHVPAEECIIPIGASEELEGHLFLIPSFISLSPAEFKLVMMLGREFRLSKALSSIQDQFDYILIDCPPSLGFLTLNALVASDGVIIPCKPEYISYIGLGQLKLTIKNVVEESNPKLKIYGVIATMYQTRLKSDNIMRDRLEKEENLIATIKLAAVAKSEIASGISTVEYKPSHDISVAMLNLADRIINGEFEHD